MGGRDLDRRADGARRLCQSCRVLLVEAKKAEFADLGAGVNAAVNLGATEISNSYTAARNPRSRATSRN
jgi:hypothetical protein